MDIMCNAKAVKNNKKGGVNEVRIQEDAHHRRNGGYLCGVPRNDGYEKPAGRSGLFVRNVRPIPANPQQSQAKRTIDHPTETHLNN